MFDSLLSNIIASAKLGESDALLEEITSPLNKNIRSESTDRSRRHREIMPCYTSHIREYNFIVCMYMCVYYPFPFLFILNEL